MVRSKAIILKLTTLLLVALSASVAYGQKIIEPIRLSPAFKQVSLQHQSEFVLSGFDIKNFKQLEKQKWSVLGGSLFKPSHFSDTTLQYWVRFSTTNNFKSDTVLIIKLSEKNQQSQLYEVIDKRMLLIGETGFGSKISNLSIKSDYWRMYLPIKAGQQQQFYLLVQKYQYDITTQYPQIQTMDIAFKDKLAELDTFPTSFRNFKLWTAGFYFAVFIYCFLKYFFHRKERAYMYYTLASLFLFFRYSLQVDAIMLEVSWLPSINNDFIFLLSFIPQSFFYILFLGEFLNVKESKYIHWFLKFCLLQWCLMLPVMFVHFYWPVLTSFTKLVWTYNAVPFFILSVLLCYHIYTKLNRKHFNFAFIGILVLAISFIFVIAPRWLEISNLLPQWYHSLNKHVDLVTLAFAIDTVLFLTTLAYRDKLDEIERNNLKIKNAENEHKILRLQMNPHFIFNCLNSINLYIEQNDSRLASNYLSKFSQLMRLSLVHSRKEKIILSEEITILNLYLELETMRFKGKLNYAFEIDNNVDTEFIEIPPMLIQPHLENAIWHGLMHKTEGGKIIISINQDHDGQLLNIQIRDNGIGRAKAAELKSKAVEKEKSYGTLITHERIAVLNQKFNSDTRLRIEDLFDKNKEPIGTLVTINIHLT